MKKMKGFRKVLALVLALMMVFSAVAVLAEGEDPVEGQDPVIVEGEGTPENPENPVNSEAAENPEQPQEGGTDETKAAVLRDASSSGETNTTGNNLDTIGPVSIIDTVDVSTPLVRPDSQPDSQHIYEVDKSNTDPYTVTVNANIKVSDEIYIGETNALRVSGVSGAAELKELKVIVNGNMTAPIGDGVAVNVNGKDYEGNDRKVILDVKGTIEVGWDGVAVNADSNNQADVTVCDVKAGEVGVATNVEANSSGKVDVTAKNITVNSEQLSVTGISINQGNGAGSGTTTVKADSVSATTTGDKSVYGLNVKDGTVIIGEESGASGKITVTGENGEVCGVIVEDGTVVVHGNGDTAISTTSLSENVHANKVVGLEAFGKSDVTVAGDVYVKGGSEKLYGVDVYRDSTVTINEGNVIVEGDLLADYAYTGLAVGASYPGQHATANVKEGSVICKAKEGSKYNWGMWAYSNDGGTASIEVKKDVTAVNGCGLLLDGDGKGEKDILIEGTLSGDTAIVLVSEETVKDTSLTVWKVESTGSNGIAAWYSNVSTSADATELFAGTINYIVKTVQTTTGTFSATKADGSALEKHHDLETAHEDERVYIKAGDGYKVTEAYNGDTKLESDEGGFFYKVARGGGILLTAVLEMLPKPEEQPVVPAKEETEAKPEVKPAEEKVESKQEAKTDEPKQEATQTVADTTSNTAAAAMRPAVYNLLKIKDKSGRADIAFRNIGTYEIKSPDGIDEGTFVTMNGRIVLTSRSGEMATVENGRLKYVVGDKTYEFEFSQAELDKLAGVKK